MKNDFWKKKKLFFRITIRKNEWSILCSLWKTMCISICSMSVINICLVLSFDGFLTMLPSIPNKINKIVSTSALHSIFLSLCPIWIRHWIDFQHGQALTTWDIDCADPIDNPNILILNRCGWIFSHSIGCSIVLSEQNGAREWKQKCVCLTKRLPI